jgi:hypothetical protein
LLTEEDGPDARHEDGSKAKHKEASNAETGCAAEAQASQSRTGSTIRTTRRRAYATTEPSSSPGRRDRRGFVNYAIPIRIGRFSERGQKENSRHSTHRLNRAAELARLGSI